MTKSAKNYCFTINNYTDNDLHRLSTLPDGAVWLIYGKEKGVSGTPHLQGCIQFSKRRTFNQAKALISEHSHIEVAKSVSASISYCKKEGDYTTIGPVPIKGSQGVRSDLESFKDSVKSGILSLSDLRERHSEVFSKYPRFCIDYVTDHAPKREVESHILRPWQNKLVEYLSTPPDDRTIVFIVDILGNSGKSWFSDWYAQSYSACQVLNPGRKADMAYALDTSIRVLFVDAPRSKQGEFIQYDFLEDVKNGRVFCGKYESRMKYLSRVHVVVMMNEQPDMTKLSEDRYFVMNANEYD